MAKVNAVAGALLQLEPDKGWKALPAGQEVFSGRPLLALPQAEIDSGNGSVRVKMMADIGQQGMLPVFESVIQIHANAKVDLDFTLDRGSVVLSNRKDAGQAKVRVRFRDNSWTLTMQQPGTMVALEFFGRYAPGAWEQTRVVGKQLKIADEPNRELIVVVLKGRVFVDQGKKGFSLQAPPGPALVLWNNLSGQSEIQRLEKLPEESTRPPDEAEKKYTKALCDCAHCLQDESVTKALTDLLKGDDALKQRFAVTAFGALGDLPHLLEALSAPEQPAARDQAILVLRAWIGRGPAQVEQLFTTLVEDRKLTPVQARNALHLLFGFDARDRNNPETYQMLISLLDHKALAARELARWHLHRLAPAGQNIPYDAAAAPEIRAGGLAQWRKLIPPGKLPPKPVKTGK